MEKYARPKELRGITARRNTGCGHIYVTVCMDNGCIVELFAKLGKAGGCATCQLESLTRAITLGLKYGIPVSEYITELEGLKCPIQDVTVEGSLSCSDAIARVLKEVTSK